MYEIITLGKVPYPGMRGQEVLEKIEMGKLMTIPTFIADIISPSLFTSFSRGTVYLLLCSLKIVSN